MSAEPPKLPTPLMAAGVDAHGMPFECCDYWPECTHVYYAVAARSVALKDAERQLAEAREALEQIAEQQQKTLGWIEAHGIVFDGPLGTDPTNWQQIAFSIYTDLCQVDSLARAALSVSATEKTQ